MNNYRTVTEVPGLKASREQLAMLYTRYAYAAEFCEDKDVLEVACGAGQGLGYLAKRARKVIGGDVTQNLLSTAREHYSSRIPLLRLDAQALPFKDASFDVVLLYEAIYYLPQPERFVEECRRVLREKGALLICTVNKEWSDFNPSPFCTRYFSASELSELLKHHQFEVAVHASFPVSAKNSLDGHIVSLMKRIAVALHLIPKTMKGKELLKRLVFGPLSSLPPEIQEGVAPYCSPVTITDSIHASRFKVLFAVAKR